LIVPNDVTTKLPLIVVKMLVDACLAVDWHKATQGLFGGGVILLTIGFLLASFHICCRCCKESYSVGSAVATFIVTGS